MIKDHIRQLLYKKMQKNKLKQKNSSEPEDKQKYKNKALENATKIMNLSGEVTIGN